MCKPSSHKEIGGDGSGGASLPDRLTGALLIAYTVGFIPFRIGELVPLAAFYGPHCTAALLGTFLLRRALSRRGRQLLYILSLVGLVYLLDRGVAKPLPAPGDGAHASKTVVVTGANAGVGYETSRRLAVEYGVQVVMGCRSEVKCNNAATAINAEIAAVKSSGSVTPMLIDLSNLQSVHSFASGLEGKRVDVLFNNAGYVPPKNVPVNEYGLDPSFTSMHLSHFFLAEELLKANPELRVVNTSSGTHHLCAIPFAYIPQFVLDNLPSKVRSVLVPQIPGCLDEEYLTTGIRSKTDGAAYIQAKVANVMHAVELPRRHPRAMAVVIDLGWVGTSIQSWMEGALTPTNLGWMRSATVGVLPMLRAILSTREELLEGLVDGSGERKNLGFVQNVFGGTEEAFSYPWWKDGANADLSQERMLGLSAVLWEESVRILQSNGY